MPICTKCGNDIKDRSWQIHQILCTGTNDQQSKPDDVAAKVGSTVPDNGRTETADSSKIATNTGIPAITPVTVVSEPTVAPAPVIPQTTAEVKTSVVPPAVVPIAHETPFNMNGDEIFYPDTDKNFIVTQFISDTLTDTEKLSHEHPANLLITGQAGGGKTSLAIQFAAINHRPIVVADFGVMQEPQQLFQTTHLVESEHGVITETRESAFIRGIETPRCVVVMDELTRVENERCLNPLMPLLDGRNSTWIDELHRRIHVADGVVFIATINEGSMFAGISSLDAALRDRFGEIFMDYLPATQESQVIQAKAGVPKLIANSLAEFAYAVRSTPLISRKVSTRQLLRAAGYYKVGSPLWRAVEVAIGNYNDMAWRQQVMEIFSLNVKDPAEYTKWTQKPRKDQYVTYT